MKSVGLLAVSVVLLTACQKDQLAGPDLSNSDRNSATDLRVGNGTVVDGQKLAAPLLKKHGDVELFYDRTNRLIRTVGTAKSSTYEYGESFIKATYFHNGRKTMIRNFYLKPNGLVSHGDVIRFNADGTESNESRPCVFKYATNNQLFFVGYHVKTDPVVYVTRMAYINNGLMLMAGDVEGRPNNMQYGVEHLYSYAPALGQPQYSKTRINPDIEGIDRYLPIYGLENSALRIGAKTLESIREGFDGIWQNQRSYERTYAYEFNSDGTTKTETISNKSMPGFKQVINYSY